MRMSAHLYQKQPHQPPTPPPHLSVLTGAGLHHLLPQPPIPQSTRSCSHCGSLNPVYAAPPTNNTLKQAHRRKMKSFSKTLPVHHLLNHQAAWRTYHLPLLPIWIKNLEIRLEEGLYRHVLILQKSEQERVAVVLTTCYDYQEFTAPFTPNIPFFFGPLSTQSSLSLGATGPQYYL